MEGFDECEWVIVTFRCGAVGGVGVVLIVWFVIGAERDFFLAFGGVVALAVSHEVCDVEIVNMECLDRFVDEGTDDLACRIFEGVFRFRNLV